jgi:hypothetical protein
VEAALGRLQEGEPLDIDALVAAHPEYAVELRGLLPTVELLANMGDPPLEASCSADEAFAQTEPDFKQQLGDFRLVREIGRGGMGVVYEAEQLALGRRVALKVLPFAALLDRQQLARFKNEARAAATLDHPNIVAIYSVGCERSVHFYAMQLIDGRSLAELIAELRGESASGVEEQRNGGGVEQCDRYSTTPLLHSSSTSIQHPASSIEHPTSSIQHPRNTRSPTVGLARCPAGSAQGPTAGWRHGPGGAVHTSHQWQRRLLPQRGQAGHPGCRGTATCARSWRAASRYQAQQPHAGP